MRHHFDLMLCGDGAELATFPDHAHEAALDAAYDLVREERHDVVTLVVAVSDERRAALRALERLDEAMEAESEDLHADVDAVRQDLRDALTDALRIRPA